MAKDRRRVGGIDDSIWSAHNPGDRSMSAEELGYKRGLIGLEKQVGQKFLYARPATASRWKGKYGEENSLFCAAGRVWAILACLFVLFAVVCAVANRGSNGLFVVQLAFEVLVVLSFIAAVFRLSRGMRAQENP